MTILVDWLDIPCPGCGDKFQTINAAAIRHVCFSDVRCDCGFAEDFEWINPRSLPLMEKSESE